MNINRLTVPTVLLSFFIIFGTRSAYAEDFIFTYDYENAEHDIFGIQRNVGIDVAMLLKDPALTGFEIIGISVDIPFKEGCSCDPTGSAWLTTRLQTEGEFNLPDIQQVNGEIKNYGSETEPDLRLDITFPEAYRLPEEGVYVGYSVSVTGCNVPGSGWTSKYPIVTVCDIDKEQSFMIHCTKGTSTLPQKYPEWVNIGEERHQALAMRVIMRGHTKETAASLDPRQTLYLAPGTTENVYVDLNNHGTQPISSIEYSYTLAGEHQEAITTEIIIDPPVAGKIGASTLLDLPFTAPAAIGRHQIELYVNKVNGVENEYRNPTLLNMEVVPFLPVHRPLIEDYTGLWCGYCPAVYVKVKQLTDKYGEDFLTVSYHLFDELQSISTGDVPSFSQGLPRVYMEDRNEKIDHNNLESLWLQRRRELAPCDIGVEIRWEDTEKKSLHAESTVRFIFDEEEADYKLAYALIEDGMSDAGWHQANEFTQKEFEGPYWDLFCGQPYRVDGIVYDDVCVSFPDPKGIEGSLPSDITGGKEYKHESTLELNKAICKYEHISNFGEKLIKDPDKLRVVVVVIDGKTGKICNAATSCYSGESDTAGIHGKHDGNRKEEEEVSTDIYSLEGIRLTRLPVQRPYIMVKRMKDGTIRTEKRGGEKS